MNRIEQIFFPYVYFNSGVDTNKCIDWTKTLRPGYKPGPDEPIEPLYTATRGFSSKKKTRNATSNRSKLVKRNIDPNTSMT
jgi:hypothetical protein